MSHLTTSSVATSRVGASEKTPLITKVRLPRKKLPALNTPVTIVYRRQYRKGSLMSRFQKLLLIFGCAVAVAGSFCVGFGLAFRIQPAAITGYVLAPLGIVLFFWFLVSHAMGGRSLKDPLKVDEPMPTPPESPDQNKKVGPKKVRTNGVTPSNGAVSDQPGTSNNVDPQLPQTISETHAL